jgi:hypothetical protein
MHNAKKNEFSGFPEMFRGTTEIQFPLAEVTRLLLVADSITSTKGGVGGLALYVSLVLYVVVCATAHRAIAP